MFEDYKRLLREFYLLKKEKHKLTINMEFPGREKLRIETLAVFLRKNKLKDKEFIKSIFNPDDQYSNLERSIERFNLDRFRPVVSYLLKGRSIRDEKLVQLIGWLLDFPSYADWKLLNDEEKKKLFDTLKEQKKGESSTLPEPTLHPRKINFYLLVGLLILISVNATGFIIWNYHQSAIRMPQANEKCMYWKVDHFEPVNCDAQGIIAPIMPLNLKTLKQQRKINLADTMTRYSIGKVWYSNLNKKYEFFTYKGAHPLDTVRILRPLTSYIISNHISYHRFLLNILFWAGGILLLFISLFLIIGKVLRNK